jgi:hypothetical protein
VAGSPTPLSRGHCKVFQIKLEVGFEYTDCKQQSPEEAAVAYIEMLEEAAGHAKRLRAEIDRDSPRGRKSEDSLDLFVFMLVGLLNIDRDHPPEIEQVIDAVYTAIKIVELDGVEALDQRADFLELPTEVREQVRRKLAHFGKLGRDAVRKRVARMAAAIKKPDQEHTHTDAIRASRHGIASASCSSTKSFPVTSFAFDT